MYTSREQEKDRFRKAARDLRVKLDVALDDAQRGASRALGRAARWSSHALDELRQSLERAAASSDRRAASGG